MKISQCLNHGKKRWRVTWRSGGRAHRRFFTKAKAAQDFARDTLEEQKQFGKEWTALSAIDRSELVQCWRQSRERGYSISEACRFFEAHGGQTVSGVTIAKLCEKFLAAKLAKGLRPESLRLLETTLDQFKIGREEQRAASVTTDEVSTWLAGQDDWGPWRRRGAIIDLGNLFSWAIATGLLARNPVSGIERPIIEHKPPSILTVDQAKALLQLCRDKHPKLLPWLVISLFSGLRAAEVERLTWENISGCYIVLASHQTKGRARRLVTVRPTLKAWLELRDKSDPGLSHMLDKRSGPICPDGHRKLCHELRKEFGGLPKNVLRHSFISYALAAGQTVDSVAEESGNSPEIIFRHYREVVTKERAQAFWSLNPDCIDRSSS